LASASGVIAELLWKARVKFKQFIGAEVGARISFLHNRFIRRAREWKDIEYFNDQWKERIWQMAQYIPPACTVLDLGCGKMWLSEYLRECRYIPVDYCDRGKGTYIYDFNKAEFPNVKADYSFVSGCMEYVESPRWFIEQISTHSGACVISYCGREYFPDLQGRMARGWKNNFSKNELIALFNSFGMVLAEEATTRTQNFIFVFRRKP